MLVGIDASRAFVDRPTGTETYSRRVIEGLLAPGSSHRYRLYCRSRPREGAFRGAELRVIRAPRLWTHTRLAWEMMRQPPDLLFVPAHVIPPVRPRLSLVTVHDLGYLRFPEAHPWRQRMYLDLSTRWNARASTHILADSEATKADLVARYSTPPEKITVAYPGADRGLQPVGDHGVIESVKARYEIEDDYFLYLGTLQPRKNLVRLVDAYAHVVGRDPEITAHLVLAGKHGWLYQELFDHVGRLGLRGRVLFPGYVADDDKAALLSGASAFVFPSLHEGFGLPVLEAQACLCPVITSTTSSLPEVAGPGALLVDPEDTSAIAEAMERVTTEPGLAGRLVQQGTRNLMRFSWEKCARTILAVIDQVSAP